jgi:DNA-binding response OmpR family regulator
MSSRNPIEPLFASALLVEDDRNLSIAISAALKKLGIPTNTASTLAKARDELERQLPELVLLDRRLPDGEGLTLCAELRRKGYQGMILVLSAAGEVPDRVKGLETGADDYLPKPFAWEEFHARLAALARRHIPEPILENDIAAAKNGLWKIDEKRLRIRGPKGWVDLTPLEFKLAQHLIRAEGSIVSREELLKDVWGFALLPKTRTVDLFLSRLRKLFESDPENPAHFLTVRGAGYRFER